MTVDQYAICPCGSGKKIKFCTKCTETVGELDRIMKMVNGGQMVAALDRLNQVLNDHPSAAWALAFKGRLLVGLREYDALQQNAERFIRLQPTNPLALTQRAAAQLFGGKFQEAAESLLEALGEAGTSVDSFTLDIASFLAVGLAQTGVVLSARIFAMLPMSASGYDATESAQGVLQELNGAPQLNLLLKAVPRMIDRPKGVPWAERYDEAARLLRSNLVLQAESKFQSLDRHAPGQCAVLLGLLTCAIWRADVTAQASLLRRLSEIESADLEQRARWQAIASLIDPQEGGLGVPAEDLVFEIDDAEQVELALTADSRVLQLPPEMLRQMEEAQQEADDSVPPRSGFQLLDRPKPDAEGLPAVSELPEVVTTVLLWGRQTDRAPRLEALDVAPGVRQQVTERLAEATGAREPIEKRSRTMPLQTVILPQVPMLRLKSTQAEMHRLHQQLFEVRLSDHILSLTLVASGAQPLRELVSDPATLVLRTALVRLLEGEDALSDLVAEPLARLSEALGVASLPRLAMENDDQLEDLEPWDLPRVDASSLGDEGQYYLLQRARQVHCTSAIRHAAEQLVAKELADELKPARLLAYLNLAQLAETPQQSLALLDEGKRWARQHDLPRYALLLSELPHRLAAGDAEGFQGAIRTLTTEYSNQPQVMAQLQQLLYQFGLINADGSPRTAPRPPAAAAPAGGGGLWTPGAGPAAPPSSPAAPQSSPTASPSPSGGGKLWVPGMD